MSSITSPLSVVSTLLLSVAKTALYRAIVLIEKLSARARVMAAQRRLASQDVLYWASVRPRLKSPALPEARTLYFKCSEYPRDDMRL
jgi:hypothetical protein